MFAFGSKILPGLAKIAEEFGEAQQVIGRLMMTRGRSSHWSGADLRDDLVAELADAKAAIAFFEDHALQEPERERMRRLEQIKYERFVQWHKEQAE